MSEDALLQDACAELAQTQRQILDILEQTAHFIPLDPEVIWSAIAAAEVALAHATPLLVIAGALELEPPDAPDVGDA